MTIQRPVALLLVASLMINVFCVGALVSHWIRPQPPMEMPFGPPMKDRLPPPAVELFRALRKVPYGPLGEAMAAAREARSAVHAAMLAEPFDKAALLQAFDALREAESELARRAQQRIAELASQLTAEERADLARFRAGRMGPISGRFPPPPMQP